jgi:hypothetical protein
MGLPDDAWFSVGYLHHTKGVFWVGNSEDSAKAALSNELMDSVGNTDGICSDDARWNIQETILIDAGVCFRRYRN